MNLLEAAQKVLEKDLLEPGRYAWINGLPLALVFESSYAHHHEEHYKPLVEWLQQHGKTGII